MFTIPDVLLGNLVVLSFYFSLGADALVQLKSFEGCLLNFVAKPIYTHNISHHDNFAV